MLHYESVKTPWLGRTVGFFGGHNHRCCFAASEILSRTLFELICRKIRQPHLPKQTRISRLEVPSDRRTSTPATARTNTSNFDGTAPLAVYEYISTIILVVILLETHHLSIVSSTIIMVYGVIQNFIQGLKYRGGWRGLLEHMYTVCHVDGDETRRDSVIRFVQYLTSFNFSI